MRKLVKVALVSSVLALAPTFPAFVQVAVAQTVSTAAAVDAVFAVSANNVEAAILAATATMTDAQKQAFFIGLVQKAATATTPNAQLFAQAVVAATGAAASAQLGIDNIVTTAGLNATTFDSFPQLDGNVNLADISFDDASIN